MDERLDRIERGQIPFIESYSDIVLEPQSIGSPLEREIVVLRIDKSKLKLYAALLAFVIVLVVVTALAA